MEVQNYLRGEMCLYLIIKNRAGKLILGVPEQDDEFLHDLC